MVSSNSYHISATMSILPNDISSPVSVAALLQVSSSAAGRKVRPVASKVVVSKASSYDVPDLLLNPPSVRSAPIGRDFSPSAAASPQLQTSVITERTTMIQHRRSSKKKPSEKNQKATRRNIFTGYWNRDDSSDQQASKQKQQQQSSSARSKASSQYCYPTGSTRTAHPVVDICQFSPSPDYHNCLRKHHELLENVMEKQAGKIPSTRSLPPLPEPLQRLRDESISSKGCGMYPLVSPDSILRKSKYAKLSVARDEEETKLEHRDAPSLQDQHNHPSFTNAKLNGDVQQSARHFDQSLSKFSRPVGDMNVTDFYTQLRQLAQSKTDLCQYNSKAVHFDPRIVITEFSDRVERSWYGEHELMTFKNETIMLAHQYVLLNPHVISACSKGSFDPITGKAKKKALYSLPVLNSLPEDFDPDMFNRQLDGMLLHGVKRILVVDPNQAILQLFRKSVLRMFPDAAVETVETAEDALRKYTMAIGGHTKRSSRKETRSFDIMIVEENLVRPPRRNKSNSSNTRRPGAGSRSLFFQEDGQTASLSRLQSLDFDGRRITPPGSTNKQSSLSSLDSLTRSPASSDRLRGMTGSQLIKRIRQLEDQVYGSSAKNFRGVIVGVSANLERDTEILQGSGADRIWSKPPPPMGISLRNQLLSALISKRQGDCSVEEKK